MTIEQAHSDVTALGFDTAPLIYFVERHILLDDLLADDNIESE